MNAAALNALFTDAVRLHQAGRLEEAELSYRRILQAAPAAAAAWHYLGVVAHTQGRRDAALQGMRRALALEPGGAEAYGNYGVALRQAGRQAEAAASYRRGLSLQPTAHGYFNLGNAHQAMGQWDLAIDSYRQAVRLNPAFSEARVSLGAMLLRVGRTDEYADLLGKMLAFSPAAAEAMLQAAVKCKKESNPSQALVWFERVARLTPHWAGAWNNIVIQRFEAGRFDDSEPYIQKALQAQPDSIAAWSNFAQLCLKTNQPVRARRYAINALACAPDDFLAFSKLSEAHSLLKNFEQARVCSERALRLMTQNAELHHQLGQALLALGRGSEAEAAFREALRVEPGQQSARNGLGGYLLQVSRLDDAQRLMRSSLALAPSDHIVLNNMSSIFRNQGRQKEATTTLERASVVAPDNHQIFSNKLLTMLYEPDADPENILREHKAWAARYAVPAARFALPPAAPRAAGRRLRIGYVSPDYRNHPAAYYLEPLLQGHDRRRVEVFAYSEVATPDDVTRKLRGMADGWVDTAPLSDDEMAARIRADGIDVLVDMAGHTANNRLLAFVRRPAPLQVTWFGYGATTGLAEMDYILLDHWHAPPEAERFYVERVWRLPEVMRTFAIAPEAPPVGPPPVRRNGRITFASFNFFVKVTPRVLALWAQILHDLPDSRLLLISRNPAEAIHARFAEYGIGPERLQVMVGHFEMSKFLAIHNEVDIALDPFPHGGATTTFHSLSMGVPVVGLSGRLFYERVNIGILGPLGLGDLSAGSVEEYRRITLALAGDLDRLEALRGDLRNRMLRSTFTNPPRFVAQVEDAFEGMWREKFGAAV